MIRPQKQDHILAIRYRSIVTVTIVVPLLVSVVYFCRHGFWDYVTHSTRDCIELKQADYKIRGVNDASMLIEVLGKRYRTESIPMIKAAILKGVVSGRFTNEPIKIERAWMYIHEKHSRVEVCIAEQHFFAFPQRIDNE